MKNGNNMYISTEELKNVVTSLKAQRDNFNIAYNQNIKSILESSSSCFSFSGLDVSSIATGFETNFKAIDLNLEKLINLLENGVIKNYSELEKALKQMFDSQFASKMEKLLGINEIYVKN